MKKVHYKYSSIFAPEIISYLKLRETTGKYIAKTESVLKDFDCFLHITCITFLYDVCDEKKPEIFYCTTKFTW